ncbi:hypothetical protein PUN28_019128 [Cardiocondyla obscurior]|uniref:Uncharacterized protein n=2 Tax=Cardiocondyla obscurior TaxID=286306 RepID=A0AAW2EEZ2_9HYME
MRHDVTTSLSDITIPRELEDVKVPEHCYRKVGYPRRREYIDRSTCVPSLYNLNVAEIQTDAKQVFGAETQTPRAATKETPMQTLSKCEFCYRPIQLPTTEGAMSSTHCIQHSSQWGYPAVVQFVRGVPCCPG